MLSTLYNILEKKPENEEVFSLKLVPDKKSLPILKPGQFNMVYAFGVGESALSISRMEKESITHTIRVLGQVTHALQRLEPGDSLWLRGPFGTSWPEINVDEPVMIIAGGLGLAPLRPVLDKIIAQQHSSAALIYGARSPSDLIFEEDLSLWANHAKLWLTVDVSEPSWSHHVGVVTHFIPKAITDPKRMKALLCGPEVMMRFSVYTLLDAGVPAENIYLSMERSMQCGYGHCGHCQWGPFFICKDGPVMNYARIQSFFTKHEL